jgi:hypothetical protein
MNTKFSFVLLLVVIAITATACTPVIINNSPPFVQAAPLANNETSAILPVSGEPASTAARETQEPRLWSGEIYLSDNSNPDHLQSAVPTAEQPQPDACMSEDSQPRRQSGCLE